ncbi:ABC transporter permease [Virgisporangium aurantiacum]|uniref:Transport permease protein n=1 Tax=Virgisporangium aurantiacum TaxID=175570 RepID=A0A8J3ZFK7_9ACTN|nr:ABC transporter permease [Virgisporangium aurantiacum]GIJ63244.1 ABC transporter [Virgisporangium aurantiacum]
MNLTYLRLEVVRVLRNKRVLVFSILLPSILLLVIGSPDKHEAYQGTTVAAYIMVSMGIFGAMSSATGAAGSIAVERGVGWNRQLRLTPLNPLKYVLSKVVLALVLVLPPLTVVYALGAAFLDVRLSAGTWALVFLGSWLSALPFAALGLIIGYVAKPESIQQVSGLLFFLLALFGGLWLPLDQMPHAMRVVATWTPAYWAADVARAPLTHGSLDGKAVLVLLAWAVGLGIIGIRRFRVDTARA